MRPGNPLRVALRAAVSSSERTHMPYCVRLPIDDLEQGSRSCHRHALVPISGCSELALQQRVVASGNACRRCSWGPGVAGVRVFRTAKGVWDQFSLLLVVGVLRRDQELGVGMLPLTMRTVTRLGASGLSSPCRRGSKVNR